MREDTPNWRALKPDEMPEYTLRLGAPAMANWNCKHCWKSNTLSIYESKERQLASIVTHVKAKCVIPPSFFLSVVPAVTLTLSSVCIGTALISRPKVIISLTGRMVHLALSTWTRIFQGKGAAFVNLSLFLDNVKFCASPRVRLYFCLQKLMLHIVYTYLRP